VTSPVFDAESAAAQVVAALLPLANPERAEQASRYLKSTWISSVSACPVSARSSSKHLDQMSGVTFREAVRRLPAGQAARLQTVYRKPVGW
jgi:hypothetical protein